MFNIKIITSTTREGHKGTAIADWITNLANTTEGMNAQLLDLAKINLPLMDEPNHPRMQQYQHEHTKRWSEQIQSADGFIIVLAEYNFGYPAPIKNALDYLFNEWRHKPAGLVSYGGASGGLRSSQMLKQVLTALSMMPLAEQVSIPFFTKYIDESGKFNADESTEKAAKTMLGEFQRWMGALAGLRQG